MERENMILRAWAEFIPPGELIKPEVLYLLQRYRVNPCIAVSRDNLGEDYAKLMKNYRDAGLEPALWPTMSDEQGYWPNERNCEDFASYVKDIFKWADKEEVKIPWLAVDLEPPYYQHTEISSAEGLQKVGKIWHIFNSNRNRQRFNRAVETYRNLQDYIKMQGCQTIVPAIPLLEIDIMKGSVKLQDYLETPLSPVNWDVISFMQYNTVITGMSREFISPGDARWYLYLLCLNMKATLGKRAAVSVGLTSTGKLGNEPYYQYPEEMLPDIEAALAAGIQDIAIFSLEGILNASNPENWLEVVFGACPRIPPRSRKVEVIRRAAVLMYRLFPG